MRKQPYSPFLLFLFCLIAVSSIAQSPADSLLDFIAKNKLRSSFCLAKNDIPLVNYNEDKLMPIGSTAYIMIAVEFAKQASGGIIDEDSLVSLSDVNKYYIPTTTDSISQLTWLANERRENHINNDSIRLVDIARGMMMYSCNANADYLLDVLGIDNVKNNNELFGLTRQTSIFPVVASRFLYQNPKKIKEKAIISGITSLSEEQYCRIIFEIHKALQYDTLLKPKFSAKDFDIKMQRLWSNRLPASTTKEYVQICKILNNRQYLNDYSYAVIAEIMEFPMEDPTKLSWLKHEGMKEGRTPWLLTKALYTTAKDGTRIEMAYFFNDLTPEENKTLDRWTEAFDASILKDESFRQEILKRLN